MVDYLSTLDDLTAFLKRNDPLEYTLRLGALNHSSESDFAADYAEFLEAVKSNTMIESIRVKVDKDSALGNFPILNTLCLHLPNVHELELSCQDLSEGDKLANVIVKTLVGCTTHFRCIAVELGYEPHVELDLSCFKHHNSLKELSLRGCECRSFFGLSQLPDALKSLEVECVGCDVAWETEPDDHLFGIRRASIMRVSSLTRLSLHADIGSDADVTRSTLVEALTEARCMQDLSLSWDCDESWQEVELCQALHGMTHLQRLELKGGDFDGVTLPNFVAANPKLEVLQLLGLDVSSEWCMDLSSALVTTSRLRELKIIGGWRIDGEAVSTLLASLSQFVPGLQELVLKHLPLTEGDCDRVAMNAASLVKATAPNLARLVIESKHFPDPEASEALTDELVNDVHRCFELVGVRLDFGLSKEQTRRLDILCELNSKGRIYMIQQGSTREEGVALLSAVSNELDCIYTHLLENPMLCYRPNAGIRRTSQVNPNLLLVADHRCPRFSPKSSACVDLENYPDMRDKVAVSEFDGEVDEIGINFHF